MTNNENNRKLHMDKYGTLLRSPIENEIHISINHNRQVRRIRTSAIETIEAILADYNPLAGLSYVFPPSRRIMSEELDLAKIHAKFDAEKNGVDLYDAAIKIAKEFEEKNSKESAEYRAELKRRKRLLDEYEDLKWAIIYEVECGHWKQALQMVQELKDSYKAEVRAVIIHAVREEAPIIVSVKSSIKKREEAALRREKIKEGVRALLNI